MRYLAIALVLAAAACDRAPASDTPAAPAPEANTPPPPKTYPVAVAWDKTPFTVMPKNDDLSMSGFYPPEEWGRLVSASPATISLPYVLSGPVQIDIHGWLPAAVAATPVVFKLGDASTSVTFGTENAQKSFVLDVVTPSDTLVIESPIAPGTVQDGRTLGLAVVTFDVKPASPAGEAPK